MNGKTIKVVEYNLSFGSNDRMVNILGVFRYKTNNNMYIIYSDVDIKYNIIYYGSSYIKNNQVLSIASNQKDTEEIVKEYIYKSINNEQLDNFQMISLDNIEGLEIISSNKIEVKPDVLYQLIEKNIPKNLEKEESTSIEKSKKKKSNKLTIIIVLILVLGISLFYLFNNMSSKNDSTKLFVCTKEYLHDTLDAKVEEENTYYFNNFDEVEKVNNKKIYYFQKKDSYSSFIKNGTMYKYMPDDKEGSWDKSDTEYWFKTDVTINVDSSYQEEKKYESAINYYRKNGFYCIEKVEEE